MPNNTLIYAKYHCKSCHHPILIELSLLIMPNTTADYAITYTYWNNNHIYTNCYCKSCYYLYLLKNQSYLYQIPLSIFLLLLLVVCLGSPQVARGEVQAGQITWAAPSCSSKRTHPANVRELEIPVIAFD